MLDSDIEIQVSALAYGGAFVGTICAGSAELIGKKAFVREVVPGEKVRARVTRNESKRVEAQLMEIINSSAHRVKPVCPQFGICGGCDLQHMNLPAQRQAKLEMVTTTLARHAGLTARDGIKLLGAELPALNYRRKINLHLNSEGDLGFYRSGSGEVVAFDHCYISSESINQIVKKLRPQIQALTRVIGSITIEQESQCYLVLIAREIDLNSMLAAERQALETIKAEYPHLKVVQRGKSYYEQIDFKTLDTNTDSQFPSGHFSQVNQSGNSLMQEFVLQQIDGKQLTELYAGAGNFSLLLAQRGAEVDAVEVDKKLVMYGRTQAKNAGLSKRLKFFALSCEEFVKKQQLRATVLLDPPRAGAAQVVKAFKPQKVKKIIYVSCNLPSLTRDLKFLCSNGYQLEQIGLIDMFAQTHHIESIAILTAMAG